MGIFGGGAVSSGVVVGLVVAIGLPLVVIAVAIWWPS